MLFLKKSANSLLCLHIFLASVGVNSSPLVFSEDLTVLSHYFFPNFKFNEFCINGANTNLSIYSGLKIGTLVYIDSFCDFLAVADIQSSI